MSLSVVPFPIHNLNDIPARLRQLADEIEAEAYGEVSAIAIGMETDETVVAFGFGHTGPIHAIGLLHVAASNIATGDAE